MRSKCLFAVVGLTALLTMVGCGGDGSDGMEIAPGCEDYGYLPPPLVVTGPWEVELSLHYLPTTNTVMVVGELPYMGWEVGLPAPCRGSTCTFTMVRDSLFEANQYTFTYVDGLESMAGEGPDSPRWASYGRDPDIDRVACMDGNEFVYCRLVRGKSGELVSEGCGLRVRVEHDGRILPAGNMADFGR